MGSGSVMKKRINFYFQPTVWLLVIVLLCAAVPVLGQNDNDDKSNKLDLVADEPKIIDDATLHPGVASAWVVGHYILASGNVDEAITYLNYAYRTLPDVVLIAMDYQDALIAAMKAEKAAYRLYTDLASATDNADLQGLFKNLAQEEAKHKLRFEVEYDDHILKEN